MTEVMRSTSVKIRQPRKSLGVGAPPTQKPPFNSAAVVASECLGYTVIALVAGHCRGLHRTGLGP